MAIEIVSFPINSMVIFHSYVSLPEGIINEGGSIATLWFPEGRLKLINGVDREELEEFTNYGRMMDGSDWRSW